MGSIKFGYYGGLGAVLNGKLKSLAEVASLSGMALVPLLCPRPASQKRDLGRCGTNSLYAEWYC